MHTVEWSKTLLGRSLFPSLGVNVNEAAIKHFSLVLIIIAKSAAKATAVQQSSLKSLAEVFLDKRIILDHLPAVQGGVRADANITC